MIAGARVTTTTTTTVGFKTALTDADGISALFKGAGPLALSQETVSNAAKAATMTGDQSVVQLVNGGAAQFAAGSPSAKFAQLLGKFDDAASLTDSASQRAFTASEFTAAGLNAPNTAAFGADITLTSGAHYSVAIQTSFDGLVGAAPIAATGTGVAGIAGIDGYNAIHDSVMIGGETTSSGFDFFSWVTDTTDEHTAAARLNL